MCESELAAQVVVPPAQCFMSGYATRCLKLRLSVSQVVQVSRANSDIHKYMWILCAHFLFAVHTPFGNDKLHCLLFPFLCLLSFGEWSLVFIIWDLLNYKLVSVNVSFVIFLAFIFPDLYTSFFCICRKIFLLVLLSSYLILYF